MFRRVFRTRLGPGQVKYHHNLSRLVFRVFSVDSHQPVVSGIACGLTVDVILMPHNASFPGWNRNPRPHGKIHGYPAWTIMTIRDYHRDESILSGWSRGGVCAAVTQSAGSAVSAVSAVVLGFLCDRRSLRGKPGYPATRIRMRTRPMAMHPSDGPVSLAEPVWPSCRISYKQGNKAAGRIWDCQLSSPDAGDQAGMSSETSPGRGVEWCRVVYSGEWWMECGPGHVVSSGRDQVSGFRIEQ